jgi:hypothetical protein
VKFACLFALSPFAGYPQPQPSFRDVVIGMSHHRRNCIMSIGRTMLKYVQRAKIHFSPTRVGIKVPWLLASIDFFFVSTIGPCIPQYPQVSARCCSLSQRCETWVSSFSQLKGLYGISCFSILSRAWLLWPLCPLRIVSVTLVLILCFDSRWAGSRFESANGWTTVNGATTPNLVAREAPAKPDHTKKKPWQL